jgi:hypothetical protein
MLRHVRHLTAARRPLPLRTVIATKRFVFVGADKPSDGESQEEVDRVALQLSRLLRVLSIGWLGSKLYEILVGSNTYLIAPSLTLVRSRHPDTRESGIWRISNWHSSGAPNGEPAFARAALCCLLCLAQSLPDRPTRRTVWLRRLSA